MTRRGIEAPRGVSARNDLFSLTLFSNKGLGGSCTKRERQAVFASGCKSWKIEQAISCLPSPNGHQENNG